MHPSKAIPPNYSGIWRVREHRIVGPHRLPAHAWRKHSVQGVARFTAQVKIVQERSVDAAERSSADKWQMTSAADSL